MPYIYVSKVNFNSKIYAVYDKKILLSDILDDIIKNIDNGKTYKKNNIFKYENYLGTQCKKLEKEEYLFNNLKKDLENKCIVGDLVRIYPRYADEFDRVTEEYKTVKKEESSKIHFYFDVESELIGFCTRNKFGYNQFNEAFKRLLEINLRKFGFEVFLKKDKSKVEEGIKKFKRIDKVIATIIPPNANNDDINDLIEDSSDYKEANIKKVKLEYESSPQDDKGLDMQATIMKNLIKSVSNGYGDLNLHGVANDNSSEVFKSNKDAAVICSIDDDSSEEEFHKVAKGFILRLVNKKV